MLGRWLQWSALGECWVYCKGEHDQILSLFPPFLGKVRDLLCFLRNLCTDSSFLYSTWGWLLCLGLGRCWFPQLLTAGLKGFQLQHLTEFIALVESLKLIDERDGAVPFETFVPAEGQKQLLGCQDKIHWLLKWRTTYLKYFPQS